LQGGSDVTYIAGGTGYGSIIRNYYSTGAINNEFRGNGTNYVNANSGNFLIGTSTDSTYKLDVSGTARFSGNVVIGSLSTTANNLHTYNSGAVYNAIETTTKTSGSEATIIQKIPGSLISVITLGAAASRGLINAVANDGVFSLRTGGRMLFSTDSTATNPNLTIASTGAATFSSSVTASGNLNLQAGATRNINFYDSSNTNINAQIQYDQLSSNTGQLFFGTNNAGTFATKLTISTEGNLLVTSGATIYNSSGA
jgi:hypothetical protein